MMSEELQGKIDELRSLCNQKVEHYQYSNSAKIPFKVHSFIEIMNLRMLDFCESACLLIEANHIVPSLSFIRTLFENAAITNRINLAVTASLKKNKIVENFDDLVSKITFGTRYDLEIQATSILTHMDKLNEAYSDTRKYYDALCEFVHPNWDGVQGSYSELNENGNYTDLNKVITSEHPLYKWIESCFLRSITIYMELFKQVKLKLPDFTVLCEKDLNGE